MNFIKEYTSNDLGICDSLIDLYKAADKKDLTYAGRVGGGSVMPEVKKSRDFFIEDAGPLGEPSDYKFDLYQEQLNGFIDSY